jgi:hypothetical protein
LYLMHFAKAGHDFNFQYLNPWPELPKFMFIVGLELSLISET